MISLYSGTPGSGKSLHLAQVIYNRCKHEAITIGNFEINREIVQGSEFYIFVDNEQLNPSLFIDFALDYFGCDDQGLLDGHINKFKEGSLLLVIDEAQLVFNVREWNMVGRKEWIHFFTQHRKFGYNIILVAQFDKMLDKQLRSLLEYEYIHRKVSNFGWKGKMLSIWSGNRMFMCVKRWYPLNERIGSEVFYYHKHLGDLYNTLAVFEKPEPDKKIKQNIPSPEKEKEEDDYGFIQIEEI